ncbi:MAG: hypothetical protein L6Q37_07625 [Bdellovibrionaceae bacterium]|nr:hypothetical protein [Pseudobdellovibrionaceae bacterium]NUM60312.1 hypothetical protein [Pseudobdellovibrionaceae bacterium]
MKHWFLFYFVFIVSTTVFSEAKDIAIAWNCNQSNVEQRPLPEKHQVINQFSWKADQAVFNTKAFTDFLERSLSSDYNYYLCNQNFIYNLKLAMEVFCETGSTSSAKNSCKLKAQQQYNSMSSKNVYTLGKQDLIVPGESLSGKASSYDMNSARQGCFLIKEQMSKQYVINSLSSYLKSLDPKCRLHTIESTVKMLASKIGYSCTKPSSTACERIKTATPELMNVLNQAYDKPISNLCLRSINVPAEINRLKEVVDQAQRCLPIAKGETRVVDSLANSNVPNNYAITRTNENNYRVDLKLEFAREDHDVSDDDVSQLKKNVDLCLQTINQKLTGPNGEHLEIQVNNPNASKNLIPNSISLYRNVVRKDSFKWTPFIDCQTMTHEMMHLVGLVDEYQEKSCGFIIHPLTGKRSELQDDKPAQLNGNKYITAFDCRSEGPKNSIMSNHYEAMRDTFGGTKEYDRCTCSDSKCDFLKTINAKNIFDVCQGSGRHYEHFTQLGASTPPPPDSAKSKSVVTNRYPEKILKKSILLPAQFRQIIQPNCRQTNNAFMECSKGSQESSIVGPCPQKPEYCKDPKKWLL